MIMYPARIWKESNTSYSVEFPDLPGCFSSGRTLAEAKVHAEEALTAYLESLDSRRITIPEASCISGPDMSCRTTPERFLCDCPETGA